MPRSGLLFLQLTIYPAAHYKPLTGQIKGDPQGARGCKNLEGQAARDFNRRTVVYPSERSEKSRPETAARALSTKKRTSL